MRYNPFTANYQSTDTTFLVWSASVSLTINESWLLWRSSISYHEQNCLRGTFITCILAVPSRVSPLPFPFILLSRVLILPGTFLLHSFIFDFNRLDPSVYSGITNWLKSRGVGGTVYSGLYEVGRDFACWSIYERGSEWGLAFSVICP